MKYILFILGVALALAGLTVALVLWCAGVRFDKTVN